MKETHSPEEYSEKLSLTNHLVWSIFLRQLFFITTINFIALFFSGIGLLFWAEASIEEMNALIVERGMPSQEAATWLEVSSFQVHLLDIPPEEQALSPEIFYAESPSRTFSSVYTVEFHNEEGAYEISVDLRETLGTLRMFFFILLVIELFFLCSGLFGNNRSIHHSLQPLQELADTTLRLNSLGLGVDISALEGELAKINASDLNSRLDLGDTHRELEPMATAINAMLDRVSAAYQSQMRFVSDASHELRTPIAVIQGYSSMLDRWGKSNPETLQESIDAIREEAKSMERLIEQLLFLARGDNKSQPLQKELLDLSSLAAEVLREETMLYPQHELIASWDGNYALIADPTLMKQLLRILLDNSLKYTSPTGRVYLSLEQTDTHVCVSVEDEGMGISPQALPQIFQRFYRADASRTRQTGGTGLGLSIAHWIALQHSAWFEVSSRQGIGTKILVHLPK